MKHLLTKPLRIITLTALSLTLWSSNAYSISPEQIYIWVARQMNIEYVSTMPGVNYVGKERLQQVFQQFSHKSYAQMENSHGKAYADEIMGMYLDKVVGLFHPETKAIFVGEFLDPCRRLAVLAHEFTHYFQDRRDGRIPSDDYRASDRRVFREMEAYHIERKFEEIFCSQHAQPNLVLAFLW